MDSALERAMRGGALALPRSLAHCRSLRGALPLQMRLLAN